MSLARISTRVASFAIASMLIACTATPRSGQQLRVNGQPVLFSGYVEDPDAMLTIQIFHWTGWAWLWAGIARSSKQGSPDECGKTWHYWEKRVDLPQVPPWGEPSPFWRWGFGASPGAPQIRARVVNEFNGRTLVSFRAGQACTPSRQCGGAVATECGNDQGDIYLACPVNILGTQPVYCGE